MPVQDDGTGASSADTAMVRNQKRVPPTGRGDTDGETAGVGSTYTAELRERENKSNTRNKGPDRSTSEIGATSMPIVRMDSRRTGKAGG